MTVASPFSFHFFFFCFVHFSFHLCLFVPFSCSRKTTTVNNVYSKHTSIYTYDIPRVKPVSSCFSVTITQSLLHFHLLFLIAICLRMYIYVTIETCEELWNSNSMYIREQRITKKAYTKFKKKKNLAVIKLLCDRTVKDVTSIKI